MRGVGVVWYFLLFGKGTSVVDRMHGMVASALKLGVPSCVIELLFDVVRIITYPPFVIKRGLNDFMVDLIRLTVALVLYALMAWKYLGLSALALPELDQTSSSGLVA